MKDRDQAANILALTDLLCPKRSARWNLISRLWERNRGQGPWHDYIGTLWFQFSRDINVNAPLTTFIPPFSFLCLARKPVFQYPRNKFLINGPGVFFNPLVRRWKDNFNPFVATSIESTTYIYIYKITVKSCKIECKNIC